MAGVVTNAGAFNFYDLSAEICKQLRAPWTGKDPAEIKHTHTIKRKSHLVNLTRALQSSVIVVASRYRVGMSEAEETTVNNAVVNNAVADADVTDVLPDDLDPTGLVGPYMFPNNNRRRVPAILYVAIGLAAIAAWAIIGTDDALINNGILVGGLALIAVGAYIFVAGWALDVDEADALMAASAKVGFPVGHASAQMGWRGLLSMPTWRILLYSNEPQPTRRALVLVDGRHGEVLQSIVEDNPEDWSEY